MRATLLILLATATFAMGQPQSRREQQIEDWYVSRAYAVLADPGRWAPEHVERARQILAQVAARRDAERREREWRMAEMERQAEERRYREINRRLNELEMERAAREGTSWSGRGY